MSHVEPVRAAIESILLDWDPMGLSHCPEAQKEYDPYVSEVYRLLLRRASVEEVFEYLWKVETAKMCLSGDRMKTEQIAQRIVHLLG